MNCSLLSIVLLLLFTRPRSFYLRNFSNRSPSFPIHFVQKELRFTKKKFHSRGHAITVARTNRRIREQLQVMIGSENIKSRIKPSSFLIRFVAVEAVEVNKDFSLADVFISCFGSSVDRRQTYLWICSNLPQIQHKLNLRLSELRRVPKITFHLIDNREMHFVQEALDEVTKEAKEKHEIPWKKVPYSDQGRTA
jgi:ribosome-binding factor A